MKKIYLLAVLATLSLTGCNHQQKQSNIDKPERPVLNVKRASNGTDLNGNPTITFDYTISPANTSDKTVIPVVRWTDANITNPIASYLSATSDSDSMTITVTCYQAFQNQATLVVTAVGNSSLTSTIPIDYETKCTGFNWNWLENNNPVRTDYFGNLDESGDVYEYAWGGGDSDTGTIAGTRGWEFNTSNPRISNRTIESAAWIDCNGDFYEWADSGYYLWNYPFKRALDIMPLYSIGTIDKEAETFSYQITEVGSEVLGGTGSAISNNRSLDTSHSLLEYDACEILKDYLDAYFQETDTSNTYQVTKNNRQAIETSEFYRRMNQYSNTYLSNYSTQFSNIDFVYYQRVVDVKYISSSGLQETKQFFFNYYLDNYFFYIRPASLSLSNESIVF